MGFPWRGYVLGDMWLRGYLSENGWGCTGYNFPLNIAFSQHPINYTHKTGLNQRGIT